MGIILRTMATNYFFKLYEYENRCYVSYLKHSTKIILIDNAASE